MVTVKRWTHARCVICQRDTDGVECEFTDKSLSGHLCTKHFMLAIRARSKNEQPSRDKEKP